jgi:uncharacterized protein YqeY
MNTFEAPTMILEEQLRADLNTAIRSGDEARKTAIRTLLSAIGYAAIPAHREDNADEPASEEAATAAPARTIDDAAALDVLRQLVKQRRDSIDAFQKAGRHELAAKEQADLEVLQGYLPDKPLSEAELRELVAQTIAEVGASGPREMGKVMAALLPRIKDRADGRLASQLVRNALESRLCQSSATALPRRRARISAPPVPASACPYATTMMKVSRPAPTASGSATSPSSSSTCC